MKLKKGIDMMETKEIKFYDDTLFGVKDEGGKVWLAITHSCKQLGFDYQRIKSQGEKIREDKVLSKGVGKFRVLTNGGEQEIFCLEEKFVPLWFAKITLTKKMQEDIPDVFEKLERYQLEAAEVLHKAFYETKEQKNTFHQSFGLEGRIEGMQVQINSMENMMCEQMEKLDSVMENMTLSTRQQQKLYKAAKDRINHLLGGAHSSEYKQNAKSYFINLWNGLKSLYGCASYKDLNPIYYGKAFDYISTWEYIEN